MKKPQAAVVSAPRYDPLSQLERRNKNQAGLCCSGFQLVSNISQVPLSTTNQERHVQVPPRWNDQFGLPFFYNTIQKQ
jgi:hypothetical protein